MKKAGIRWRKWHRHRAVNEFKRTKKAPGFQSVGSSDSIWANTSRNLDKYDNTRVTIWQGGAEQNAICTSPPQDAPQNLCFRTNLKETIEFFEKIRVSFEIAINQKKGSFVRRPKKRGLPRISGYIDFSKITSISMAAAVVLTADYDRLKHFMKEVPPTVNLSKWDRDVVTRLDQLGFFRILGHAPDPQLIVQEGDSLLMRVIRSKNCATLAQVDVALMELGRFLSLIGDSFDAKITHTLSIISEIMSNVTQHAYQPEIDFKYNHLSSFWVSAEANRSENTLRIVLYDQGATIPVTYPRSNRTSKVKRYLRRALTGERSFDYNDDGTYIRAALRYGGSRTDEDYRGKGLPQMSDLLDTLGGGELQIFSRGGWCARGRSGRITSGSHRCSIGGTLVEWKIEL